MTTQTQRKQIHIGHSPDPDDAFMWYPLANFPDGGGPGGKTYEPKIDTGEYDFVHVLEDIQSLNERSEKGELEITALSIHQYPYVAEKYALTSCGSSMGDGYGPMLIAKDAQRVRDLILPQTTPSPEKRHKGRVAIPGERTTAWLALQLYLLEQSGAQPGSERAIEHEVVMFDQIIEKVASGEYDAGVIIHEGQLTYGEAGLECIVDLGKWWTDTRGLPLPLGGNAIRRDLGEDACRDICKILKASIEYALAHREEAVEYALNYARDMGADLADQFVGMYVNDWTLDYGDRGRAAVQKLLDEGAKADIVPEIGKIDFIEPK